MLESILPNAATENNFVSLPGMQGADRSPLLMLHGVTRRWQTFLPLFSAMALRRPLEALDFRGHGRTRPSTAGYRVVDYIQDALDFVQQHSPGRVILYGHSLGAMVAAAAAAKLGSQVEALVLEDPPLQTMGNRIQETPLLSLFQAMHRVASGDRSRLNEMVQQLSDSAIEDPETGSKSRLGDLRDRASLRFTASCLQRLDSAVLEPIVAGQWLEGYDADAVFSELRCPTLLLQADPQYGGMLIDDDAARIVDLAEDITRVRLPRCSHLIHWDQTSMLLNYVLTFLETVES